MRSWPTGRRDRSFQPGVGGAILAHGTSRAELETRVAADPFVAAHVVTAEILEVTPSRVDERLALLGASREA
jgi:hypothetical protein